MPGPARVIQRDFSGGMFRSVAPELIPENGAWDIANGLLQEDGAVQRRGGATYYSATAVGSPILGVWDGLLRTGGQTTVIFRAGAAHEVAGDGTVTDIASSSGILMPGRPAALDGVLYLPGGKTYDGATIGTAPTVKEFYAVVANRLLAAQDDRVLMSDIVATVGAAPTFDPTNFHLIPGGVRILGIAGLRDQALVFTTGGAWLISGLALNLTDADGNVQQRLDHYAQDLILWGDAGIAAWEGGLVVPGTDAVWLIALGVSSEAPQAFDRISGPIAALYREYVRAGYRPGQASVHESVYLLPILSGDVVIDTLACRLDLRSRPWTHLSGMSAKCAALAPRVNPASNKPDLLGGHHDGRLLRQEWFEPSASAELDADGSTFRWSLTTRDFSTGQFDKNTITKLRASYQLVDVDGSNPTIDAFYIPSRIQTVGTKWGQMVWGADSWSSGASESVALETLGMAPEDAEGATPFTFAVRRKARFARFRLRSDSSAAWLSLRALELFVRDSQRF